jgi:hypothetical protein
MAESAEKATPSKEPAAGDPVASYRETGERIRARVDRNAKLLGSLGTIAVTAVGLAKISDLFPLSSTTESRIWFGLAVFGFVLAVAAVLYVATRLSKVGEPIVMRSDLDEVCVENKLSRKERARVASSFKRTADLNRVDSLAAYEAAQHRLRRIARRTDDPAAKAGLEADAAAIATDLGVTFAGAWVDLLRRRAARAVRGAGAWVAYTVFVAGFLLFALGTDYVQSDRSDRLALIEKCAKARKADAAAKLPSICSEPAPAAEPPAPTAVEVRATISSALLKALQDCTAAVAAGTLPATACDRLRTATRQSLP